jgi:hypothetical protein
VQSRTPYSTPLTKLRTRKFLLMSMGAEPRI